MYGLGTIINTAAIVAGGLGGILFGRFLHENVQDTLTKCCGVSTLFIAITGALEQMLNNKPRAAQPAPKTPAAPRPAVKPVVIAPKKKSLLERIGSFFRR